MTADRPPSIASPIADQPEQLRLFDCSAPFFVDRDDDTINWSKIPFRSFERDGLPDPEKVAVILDEFDRYVATMAALGFNAVAIDDLAHLVAHDFYPGPLRTKLDAYRRLYARLFATIKAHRLKLFVITDYTFANAAIERHLTETGSSEADLFLATLRAAFASFGHIDGIVLRIGESDGVDVEDDFTSRLTLKRPQQARAVLRRLLPLVEEQDKTLIFRTWTLGAYPVGDLMWNQRTYDAIFADIASDHLIVSIKYGDTDFFRYLKMNAMFANGPHKKIVELQCRREYEGMGEYPSFVGWSYAEYLRLLREHGRNIVGIYALQAGGWSPFTKLAYCAEGSIWNELNTYATIKLFVTAATVDEIVTRFCRERGIAHAEAFLRLLRLSDTAIEEGLYIKAFAEQTMYFQRVRIPPLLWVFWNNVTVGGIVGLLHRHLVRDKGAAVAEGYAAVETVREMQRLARRFDLPADGIAFQLDTFVVLAHLREVLLAVETPATRERLEGLLANYRGRHPRGYQFDVPVAPERRLGGRVALLVQVLVRHQTDYRRGDQLLLNRHLTRLKALLVRRQQANLPRFVNKQGMTSDVLLR